MSDTALPLPAPSKAPAWHTSARGGCSLCPAPARRGGVTVPELGHHCGHPGGLWVPLAVRHVPSRWVPSGVASGAKGTGGGSGRESSHRGAEGVWGWQWGVGTEGGGLVRRGLTLLLGQQPGNRLCFSLFALVSGARSPSWDRHPQRAGRGRAAARDKCDSLAMASPFTVTVCFCLPVQ